MTFATRTGILWWNLRDGWPVISDAITDYYCSKKLAYYYIRRVQHDACVMIGDTNKEGNHPVIAVNDTRTKKRGTVTVRDIDTKKVLFTGQFVLPANGKTTIGHITGNNKQAMWLIEYTIDGQNLSNHYLAGKAPFKLNDYERWHKKLNIEKY